MPVDSTIGFFLLAKYFKKTMFVISPDGTLKKSTLSSKKSTANTSNGVERNLIFL